MQPRSEVVGIALVAVEASRLLHVEVQLKDVSGAAAETFRLAVVWLLSLSFDR